MSPFHLFWPNIPVKIDTGKVNQSPIHSPVNPSAILWTIICHGVRGRGAFFPLFFATPGNLEHILKTASQMVNYESVKLAVSTMGVEFLT